MSYDYYCVYCGKGLNQTAGDNVGAFVYDLSPILTGGQRLSSLKFRVTEEQVARWAEKPGQFSEVRLTQGAVFGILSQPWNHNRPEIANLTMAKIPEVEAAFPNLEDSPDAGQQDNAGSGLDEEKTNNRPQADPDNRPKESTQDLEVLRLFQGSNVKGDIVEAETGIKPELQKLWNFAKRDENKNIFFEIKFEIKRDVTHGITKMIELRQAGRDLGRSGRICPVCGSKVIEQAGEVPHRMVGFIANQRSAKTSTIIALSAYMDKAVAGVSLTGTWGEATTIPEVVGLCPPITPDKEHKSTKPFWRDFKRYGEGLSPQKTQDIVYNPTFYVEDFQKKRHLLTLVDIPGEYCPRQGEKNPRTGEVYTETTIDEEAILQYQIILNCDAYIICFDASALSTKSSDNANKSSAVSSNDLNTYLFAPVIWANKIQALHNKVSGRQGAERFVPMMVLLTKCEDLEKGFPKKDKFNSADPLEKSYMFADDYREMMPMLGQQATTMQAITEAIMRAFNDYGDTNRAFFSMLRCSPFGFEAPGYDVEQNKNVNEQNRLPTPKHVDDLMKWILRITGCIPTTGKYDPETGEDNVFELPVGYYATKQFRDAEPRDDNEALLRNVLFVNPGYFDRRQTKYHPKGFWFDRFWFQLSRKINKKLSNLTEEK